MNFNKVKNIIFDFGAVVINIDVPAAYRAFAKLSGLQADEVQNLFENQGAYADFESGRMSNEDFRKLLRSELKIESSDEELDEAWNSMLLDVPLERVERIAELKKKYNVYLLSNTNAIHVKRMKEMFLEKFGMEDFTQMFHKRFLSYEIQLLKPDPSIYEYVLNDLQINREETIFLDDTLNNVNSANAIGLPTIQVIPGKYTMMEILKDA